MDKLGGWNYRVVRKKYPVPGDEVYEQLGIHEAFYDENPEIPSSITEEPVEVTGETLDEVAWTLEKMKEALERPVLDYDEIGRPPD